VFLQGKSHAGMAEMATFVNLVANAALALAVTGGIQRV